MTSSYPLVFPSGRAIDCVSGRILDVDVFLSPREDVPHFGDFMLHQVFVKIVGDLQPAGERNSNHIIIAVIHQGHLALEIIDIMFEVLSGLHLNRDEVIVVLLKLPSGSILVIESLLHLFEGPK